jgi:4-amino-4-deoxy-L-arabinose transferase-like glycosyltransferase
MSDTRSAVSESERRNDLNPWTAVVVIGLIVAVGAVLRFWGLAGGLPSSLGVDEPQIMTRSLAMVKTGDFNPHFFDYPGLYLYLQAAVIVARFLAGASAGAWSSLAQVTDYDFYLWGRALTAAFGTATVYLVYRAGTRWGTSQALIAAAVFAVLPIHVRESHYVLTDVPMTFFVALALVLSLRAHEQGSLPAFAWAGVAAGLAAGTKYTGWVSILMPLVAAATLPVSRPGRWRHMLAGVAGFSAAFLLAAPFTVLDLPGFLDGFGHLAAAVPRRAMSADPGWQVYLKHLRMSMGWPGFLMAGAGLVVFVVRLVGGPRRARFAIALVFLPVFWLMLIDRTLIFARYLLPAVPFVCLLVAEAAVSVAAWLGHRALPRAARTAVVTALLAGALAEPALTSVWFDRDMGRQWTYSLAIDWIAAHVKPGARIVHEAAALHFPVQRYQVEYARSLADKDLDFYVSGNIDYVVATSAVYGRFFADRAHFPGKYLAYQNIFARLSPVHTVQPSPEHPGPEVRIFEVPR